MAMITRSYEIKFLTPAFLGDAEQRGAWRTPPFKALLRHWWRVGFASKRYDQASLVADMRRSEDRIFGTAAGNSGEASQLRMRLSTWAEGKLTRGESLTNKPQQVSHPEIKQKVDPLLYLGYGPLTSQRNTTILKTGRAIKEQETAILRLAYPDADAADIDTALLLMSRFGTIGGRSRNGWGSFKLGTENMPDIASGFDFSQYCRPWKDALKFDWPHCIGASADNRPLVWELTNEEANWQAVLGKLAELKIKLRTNFKFNSDKGAPYARHWLSYPVTKNHEVPLWRGLRLPNSLRFKVRQGTNGLAGWIFHCPCLPPKEFSPRPAAIIDVWTQVHDLLDNDDRVKRVTA